MEETSEMPRATTDAKREILQRQSDWGGARRGLNAGYFDDPASNMPWLTAPIRREIELGDGAEFGKGAKPGKICALHSSSALAVNFFGYWHSLSWPELAAALGVVLPKGNPQFERKFRTGIGPRSPNMDVTLSGGNGLLAIESKFTEWLGTSGRNALRDAYLPSGKRIWTDVGLRGAQSVAERYRDPPKFAQLDVPQLLKHMLGLATEMRNGPWRLLLVWYGPDSAASDDMQSEIALFSEMLGADAERFHATTYQQLWAGLRPKLGREHANYRDYLDARYF